MKNRNKVAFSRRNFIKTSALASGGLLIGFNFFTACKEAAQPPVDISKLNFNDFNAFINRDLETVNRQLQEEKTKFKLYKSSSA